LNEARGSSPAGGAGRPAIWMMPWMSMFDSMNGIATTRPTSSTPGSAATDAVTRSK